MLCSLTEAGADYYSGNYAVLDGHGLLHPFGFVPQPVTQRTGSGIERRRRSVGGHSMSGSWSQDRRG